MRKKINAIRRYRRPIPDSNLRNQETPVAAGITEVRSNSKEGEDRVMEAIL
jgi:hypothetical protein